MVFVPLTLPQAPLKISRKEGKLFVFCPLRSKKLSLTPEEWVRQHVIHFLITHRGFPQALLASEVGLEINSRKKRCDLLAYSRNQKPVFLVECKAPDVKLSEDVLFQIAQYNFEFGVHFFCITNGIDHKLFRFDPLSKKIVILSDYPNYDALI